MKIKKVAVLGAGAVGSYVIWGLSSRNDIELGVIAEGERAERLKQNGCTINGKIYHPEVWNPGETDAVDLLIVALKYGSLSAALESIQKATTENTVIMSLMNGVDSEEIIAEKVGVEHLLPAVIKVASHKEEDGYHLILRQQSELFLANLLHLTIVIASGQSKNCSRIPESISGRQSMQEKRCGASFG